MIFPVQIAFNRHCLLLDGQPTLIRSGAMHYFRLPHADLWRDRLSQLKAAGYNTVDLYFNWDFHSPAPGQYDFSGIRDVDQLLAIAVEIGLYVIARPGPYINAETNRGGLPAWLMNEPDVILRNREDGVFTWSERYMSFVEEWYDQILPKIKACPNVIMVQIENEYATDELEPEYFEALTAIVRRHGITAPTMHNDFYGAGLYADQVDIYAMDNYSVTDFNDWNWRGFEQVFSIMDHLEETLREEACVNRPLMVAELQAGWFAGWKTVPYSAIHESLGRDHIGMLTRSFLGQGGTIFNHYKAIGGTNWGHLGATDAYTSYDFAAPISELGLPTERLFEAKRINNLLATFDMTQTNPVPKESYPVAHHPCLYQVRENMGPSGGYWLFYRNLGSTEQSVTLPMGITMTLAPHQMRMLPFETRLSNNDICLVSSTEPLAQASGCLILSGETPFEIVLSGEFTPADETPDSLAISHHPDDALLRIKCIKPLAPQDAISLSLGHLTLVILGTDLTDRLWIKPDAQGFWAGPDIVRFPNQCYSSSPGMPLLDISHEGDILTLPAVTPANISHPEPGNWGIALSDWPATDASEAFIPVSGGKADMDSNHIHEGAVWYRLSYSGIKKVLTLDARHIWGVSLNGQPLMQGHTFHVHPAVPGPTDHITLHLPEALQSDASDNELLIWVESLGHHKGFHDDTRESRGVISLELDGQDVTGELSIRPVRYDRVNPVTSKDVSAPRWLAKTTLNLQLPETVIAPVELSITLPLERVTVYINDWLIGKYWHACQGQTRFYLPPGVLNTQGSNNLALECVDFGILPNQKQITDWLNTHVEIILSSVYYPVLV